MIVQTKAQLFAVLDSHQAQLKRFGVKRCGLFGSFVRDQGTPNSDIDLLVEFEPGRKTFDNFIGLVFYLEDLIERKIDLVTLESLSPYIGPHILQEVEYAPFSA